MPKTQTPRQEALADLEQHQSIVVRWEAERAAAEAELASLQARAGEEVLADPAAGERLTGDMQRLRDRIDIDRRVVAAATPKLEAAKSPVIEAEAVEWDAEAARRRGLFEKHEARTRTLLARLEHHEGVFVPAPLSTLQSRSLRAAVTRAELRAGVLRDVAAGVDPSLRLDQHRDREGAVAGVPVERLYGETIYGPHAVRPLAVYTWRLDHALDAVAAHDEWVASGAGEKRLAELREKRAKRVDEREDLQSRGAGRTNERMLELATMLPNLDELIAETQERIDSAPATRAELQRAVDELTGATDREPATV